MADVDTVEVVVAHGDRATLRVGEVFLKIDADQSRTDIEVQTMALAPVPTPNLGDLAAHLARECAWLVENDILPADVVTPNRRLAETALRPRLQVFIHGDLQIDHVFVAGDKVTGVIDWFEGARGDALYDLATLTLGHPECLGDLIAGYRADVDRDLIRAWWSFRCLTNVRWLVEHGYGPHESYPEVAVLRSWP